MLIGLYVIIIIGRLAIVENAEKKNTIVSGLSFPLKLLTHVYAAAAVTPPINPASAGIASRLNVGLITNKAPINARMHDIVTTLACLGFILSFKNKVEKIITKNGLNLLSILASESTSLSIA